MNPEIRNETKLLIARQIAMFNGVAPLAIQVSGRLRDSYMTLAESILATIERKQKS